MRYRYSYSYLPQTLYRDGDLIDVVIVMPIWLSASAVIDCRPVGVMAIADEHDEDAKIIAVPGLQGNKVQKRGQIRLLKRQPFPTVTSSAS